MFHHRRPSCRRLYGKVVVFGVLIVVLLCLVYKVNQLGNEVSRNAVLGDKDDDGIWGAGGGPRQLVGVHPSKEAFEQMILQDLAMQRPGLGDRGEPVRLSGSEYELGEKDLAKIALNEELSKHLSFNRTTPDGRSPHCRRLRYDTKRLPSAAVIIIFYNEPYSVILRTVHSVINTASENLKQVILVDDASTNEDLGAKLDYYVATRLSKHVKIIRLKRRMGLIRARLAGARAAPEDILIFLDAHCECMRNWLEPLASRIGESRTSVVVPIIDVIDAKDFHYSTNGYDNFQVGGFTWNGHFDWIDVPKRERIRQKKECKDRHVEVCPTHSPTMAGGLFAIDRAYFWEIGSYDEDMDGWGGENLEMSFRIWQCGGTLETIPCSRIGHVFREFHPYKFPNNKDTHGINTVRLAKVWMDKYQYIYLSSRPDLADNNFVVGDISKRLELRNRLQCKSFEWYLKNIYPEKFVPIDNVQGYGRFENKAMRLCLDDLQQSREDKLKVGVYWCHDTVTHSQFFSLTNEGLIRVEEGCFTVDVSSTESRRNEVLLQPCTEKSQSRDKWELTANHQLRFVELDMCLDVKDLKSSEHVYVTECDPLRPSQKWEIIH